MRGSVFSDKNLCLIIFKPLKSLHCRIESESTFFAMFAVVFRDIICGFPSRIHSGGLLFSQNSIQQNPSIIFSPKLNFHQNSACRGIHTFESLATKKQRQIVKKASLT